MSWFGAHCFTYHVSFYYASKLTETTETGISRTVCKSSRSIKKNKKRKTMFFKGHTQ